MAARWCLIVLVLALAPAAAQASTFVPSFKVNPLPTPCAAGSSATNVLTGDFNGDHKRDLAIVCSNPHGTPPTAQISVLLGNGDGTFQTPRVTSIPSAMFVATNFGSTPFNGNPSVFNPNPPIVLALDVNGDGRTDIVFDGFGRATSTNEVYTVNVTVLLAAADGTLGAASVVAANLSYYAEAFADVNGDGIPDLLLDGGGVFTGLAVMLGEAGGAFSAPSPVSTPAGFPSSIIAAAADFNGDGKPDLVIADSNVEDDLGPGNSTSPIWILLNHGGGSFGTPAEVFAPAISDGYKQFLAGDFNGDGKLDIAAGLGGGEADFIYVLLGNGDGTFQQPTGHLGALETNLVGLDLNGDGKLDLAQNDASLVLFYLSNGDGTFQTLPAIGFGVPFNPSVVADFSGDGKPDMADTASVLINTTIIAATAGALNGASFATTEPLTRGSLVSIFGADFASSNAEASAIPLPPTLGGVSVTVGGTPAPLLFVSPSQINVQVPWEVSGSTADIVVTTAQGTALAPFSASIGPVSPGIFTTQSGKGQAIAINPDGSLAGPTGSIPGLAVHPVNVGDALIILATGLGAVSPSIADGAAAGDTLRYTSATPTVTIGGTTAPLAFSGLSPQFVGVNQLNVTVPKVAAGVVALQISMGGIVTSNLVTIAVQEP
jgi:uncharacterized protein (TIGR03437 family)